MRRHGPQTKGKQEEPGAGEGRDARIRGPQPGRSCGSAGDGSLLCAVDPSVHTRPPSGQPTVSQVLPDVSWGRSRPVEGRGVASWGPFLLRLRFTPAPSSRSAWVAREKDAGGAGGPSPRDLWLLPAASSAPGGRGAPAWTSALRRPARAQHSGPRPRPTTA